MPMQIRIKDVLNSIKNLTNEINEDKVNELIEIILNSNSIFTVGDDFSQLLSTLLTAKLVKLGINSYTIGSVSAPAVEKNDCIISFSNSGESKYVVNTIKIANQKIKPKTVSITSNLNSPLSKNTDMSILIKSTVNRNEVCPDLNFFVLASATFCYVLIDKIYQRTNYNQTVTFGYNYHI
ncbi:MAG: SIS domain-containing protein [Methanobrevibacter sp.]|jgi:D-arabinose 5-phosphate isomerase GutQ|nr:SIS domain-containing protein [Candidatus Methanovirga australis]